MQRKDGHLHGEGEREAEEHPSLGDGTRWVLYEKGPVEAQVPCLRRGDRRHRQDGDQHGEAPDHGVDQEGEGREDPPPLTPDPDQEVERNQHRFPEDVEEDEVESEQHAGGRSLEHQQQQDELLEARCARVRDQHGEQREEPVQGEQEEAEAVDAQVVADAQARDPAMDLFELEAKAARAMLETAQEQQHQDQSQ